MKRNMLGLAFCLMISVNGVSAAPFELEQLVGQNTAKILLSGESVKKIQLKETALGLAPSGEGGVKTREIIAKHQPNLLVESLFLYKKPTGAQGRSWSEAERTGLFNAARSFNSLSGIEYYSASRKRMRVFYESSFVIANPESRVAQPDPKVNIIPAESTVYALQKDLTFGENVYKYDFVAQKDYFFFSQVNLTQMNYGLIPILGKDRLKTIVLIADTNQGLLFYTVSAARASLIPGIEGKVRDSFSNRADAIFAWFKKKADGVF